jgi:hypothetical protein
MMDLIARLVGVHQVQHKNIFLWKYVFDDSMISKFVFTLHTLFHLRFMCIFSYFYTTFIRFFKNIFNPTKKVSGNRCSSLWFTIINQYFEKWKTSVHQDTIGWNWNLDYAFLTTFYYTSGHRTLTFLEVEEALYACVIRTMLVFLCPACIPVFCLILIFRAEVTKILTFYAQACHELVPPEVQ